MRHIQKQPEPPELSAWKAKRNPDWDPGWDDFMNPTKALVMTALRTEQGSICCYCMGPVGAEKDDCHIEHFRPRKGPQSHPPGMFDYGNLHAVCEGEPEKPTTPFHCDRSKGEWYSPDLVSPLEADCATYFTYTLAGQIRASTDPQKSHRATETIDRLGLDIPKLRALRKAAMDGLLLDTLEPKDVPALVASLEQRDAEGRLTPYLGALEGVLRDTFGA